MRRQLSLHTKYVLVSLGILLLLLFGTLYYFSVIQQYYADEQIQLKGAYLHKVIELVVQKNLIKNDPANLKRALTRAMGDEDIASIQIQLGEQAMYMVNNRPFMASQNHHERRFELTDDLNHHIGDLTITFWGEPLDGRSTRVQVLNAVIVIDLIVLVGLILHLAIRELVSQPLWAFIEATQRVARGEFDSPITVPGASREEEDLASNFNEMVEKLAQSERELREANTSLEERVSTRTSELMRSKAFSEAVIATVREGIYAVDSEKRITTFNQGAESITGLRADEALGRPCYEVMKYPFCKTDCILERLHGEDPDAETSAEEWLDLEEKERRTWVISGGLFREEQDPPDRSLETQAKPVTETNADRAPSRFLGGVETIKDLSHIRRLQDQLRRADKLSSLGTLAAGIAHELNNPLSNIKIYAQLLDEEMPSEGPDSDSVRHILEQSDRASSIIRKMLEFAGGGAGDGFEPLPIANVVHQALGMVSYQLETSRIETRVDIPADVPPVLGHRISLQQVLINLFTNAAQAMRDGGGILAVQVRHREDRIEVRVADTGSGIDPDTQTRIFDPFFTSKDVGEGTGLGLSITYGIIREHQGDILVESRPRDATSPTWEGLQFPDEMPPQPDESSGHQSSADHEGYATLFTITLPRAGGPAVDGDPVIH